MWETYGIVYVLHELVGKHTRYTNCITDALSPNVYKAGVMLVFFRG